METDVRLRDVVDSEVDMNTFPKANVWLSKCSMLCNVGQHKWFSFVL